MGIVFESFYPENRLNFYHFGLKFGMLCVLMWGGGGGGLKESGLQLGRKDRMFWLKNGPGFKEAGGTHPLQKFRGVPPARGVI